MKELGEGDMIPADQYKDKGKHMTFLISEKEGRKWTRG